MNEADTCRVLVTPALRKAGWDDPHWRMTEQHYFTDGQIVLIGNGHKRQKGKKADYLLRYEESFPIAVVEAKAEDLSTGHFFIYNDIDFLFCIIKFDAVCFLMFFTFKVRSRN